MGKIGRMMGGEMSEYRRGFSPSNGGEIGRMMGGEMSGNWVHMGEMRVIMKIL